MKQKRLLANFSLFFIICVVFSLSAILPVCGENVPKGKPLKTFTSISGKFNIYGTIVDITPDISEESLTKLADSRSQEEFEQALSAILTCRPIPDVVVVAQGKSVTKKAISDSKGNFKFIGLPAGDYEIIAQAPSRPTGIRGVTRMAVAKKQIRLAYNLNTLELQLRTDMVNIKGRIIDVDGKPVAGAKVTAILEVHDQEYLENHAPPTWSTVANADGYYELQGLKPVNLYYIAGYLNGGELHALNCVDIYVKANGFTQSKKDAPKVPLVTEELLDPARRLLKAMSQMAQQAGGTELKEREGLTFPSSKGNTITGIDIVLERAGENVR